MRLLLDTQVFIWLTSEPERLPEPVSFALRDVGNDLVVSAATVWEIAIKVAKGKLDYPLDQILAQVSAIGAALVSMTPDHALAAAGLPRHHEDPFDRMLVAQSRLEGLTLVSSDALIAQYDVDILPS